MQARYLRKTNLSKEVNENVTAYCEQLIPYMQEMCKVVFPCGKHRLDENRQLYVECGGHLPQSISRLCGQLCWYSMLPVVERLQRNGYL
jgi:hypothetical protein